MLPGAFLGILASYIDFTDKVVVKCDDPASNIQMITNKFWYEYLM